MTHRTKLTTALPALGLIAVCTLGDIPARAEASTADMARGEGASSAPGTLAQEAGAPAPDSLYRAGRAALNGGRYREAARIFGDLVQRHPDFSHVPDALYWRALSLYRLGDERELREALRVLERLDAEYPDARTIGDASTLATRINGLLARGGDAEAAAEIMESVRISEQVEARVESEVETDVETNVRQSVDSEVRVAALNALLQMDSDRALPLLRKVLRECDDCSAELRRRALFMVAQQADDSTAAELLLETARSDPDSEARRQAVFWLSEVDDPRAVDALREVLSSPSDSALHEQAAFALAQHGGEEATAALRKLARDASASSELRGRAVFWLGQETESAGFLRELFHEVSDPELKERILFSVAEGRGEARRSWLVDVARDDANPTSVRKKALFWAGQAEGPIQPLVELYDGLGERELREQVLFAVTQSDAEGAVDWLIEVARSEDDPELRKRAIFWLGQSDDPRAAEVLTEIVGSGGGGS